MASSTILIIPRRSVLFGGNLKKKTCLKSLINIHTKFYCTHCSPFARIAFKTLVVIGTDCLVWCKPNYQTITDQTTLNLRTSIETQNKHADYLFNRNWIWIHRNNIGGSSRICFREVQGLCSWSVCNSYRCWNVYLWSHAPIPYW